MISGIGSYNSYSSYMRNQVMGRSDPSEMFETTDTDGSGGISQSELDSWIDAKSEKTGSSIDTTDAVSTYDADGDGELNEDELGSFMAETMPPPPGMMGMGPSAPADSLFPALDTDSSSGLSLSELSEGADAMDVDSTAASSSGGGSGSSSSVISEYDTNEDGVLSAAELQAYLDDIEESNPTMRMREAISNYSVNHFDGGSFNMQDVFMKMGETGGYSPIDISG